jgi:SAM-dependent methyltransferase
MTRTLDLGCGLDPKNPFNLDEVFGIDIRESHNSNIKIADLNIEGIPFDSQFFDAVTAFDFIEHVPRILYAPKRIFPFINLMNEIHRVLKYGGFFLSYTPAFPQAPAWRDPTHVNIITEETFPQYFCEPEYTAKIYGFNGGFRLIEQYWHTNGIHLVTTMQKL